jgi:hypothetical protein
LPKLSKKARKSAFADFPWNDFPFRSPPEYGTLKDRFNKALREVREAGEFELVDVAILLETIYRTWGSQSKLVLASLPAPFDAMSRHADSVYQILSDNDGYLLPQ